MDIGEFLSLVASEGEFSEERVVKVRGPELEAVIASRRGMPLLEYMAHPDLRTERRALRWGHVLGTGLPAASIDEWTRRAPGRQLPIDLRALLQAVDGIHLWADLDIGRSYFGIAPLAEWTLAGDQSWNRYFPEEHFMSLVILYHANSDEYVLLTRDPVTYRWVDPELGGFGELAANSVAGLLDWIWAKRAFLDPRRVR